MTEASPEAQFRDVCSTLEGAINAAIRPWLTSSSAARLGVADLPRKVDAAISEAEGAVASRIRQLMEADIDEPMSGPLETIRQAIAPLTETLVECGAQPVPRDPHTESMRPLDVLDLGPMTFHDLSEEVHEAGIAWGAGKAWLHRARHAE